MQSGLRMAVCLLAGTVLLAGCEPTISTQTGPRGTGQVQLHKPGSAAATLEQLNRIPEPEDPADPDPLLAKEAFENVKVLHEVRATEFSRLMQALSTWVSPEEGCDFCHNPDKLDSDEKYTKVVARRMVEMTWDINTKWKSHVGETGVTCWTCHRGEAVPSGDWFDVPGPTASGLFMRGKPDHSMRRTNTGNSALPFDALSKYLAAPDDKSGDNELRVQGKAPLRSGAPRPAMMHAETTYSMMMYMSESLGVNCSYCHNTRALAKWEESTPQRATAWHGIRMVRELNASYLTPLTPLFPDHRLGPSGDGPKIGCATCHKGTFKPLNGVSPLTDYPVLAAPALPAPKALAEKQAQPPRKTLQ